VHELSLAMNMVAIAQEEGERLGSPIRAVHVRLGPMSGVIKDQLVTSYEVACRDTSLQGSRLVIEETPLIVFCPKCQLERSLNSPQRLRCPECNAPTPKIVSGRELQIVGLEIDDEQ
jgi:hydrogenase nickel incorporation protein HypA/HybF